MFSHEPSDSLASTTWSNDAYAYLFFHLGGQLANGLFLFRLVRQMIGPFRLEPFLHNTHLRTNARDIKLIRMHYVEKNRFNCESAYVQSI